VAPRAGNGREPEGGDRGGGAGAAEPEGAPWWRTGAASRRGVPWWRTRLAEEPRRIDSLYDVIAGRRAVHAIDGPNHYSSVQRLKVPVYTSF
jgi:hypothetical protein